MSNKTAVITIGDKFQTVGCEFVLIEKVIKITNKSIYLKAENHTSATRYSFNTIEKYIAKGVLKQIK